MGSCFSKCKPKKKQVKEEDPSIDVHEKVVVSRDPPPEVTKLPLQKPLSLSPAPSTASFSSFSCSAASKHCAATAASSSSSSSSYSSCGLKERSFSNEFLLSCAKENPHAVGLNKNIIHSQKKRARAASPTLVRHKSFRKEQSSPSRGLPPSRRFNGDANRIFPLKEQYYRKTVVSRGIPKRESFGAPKQRQMSITRDFSSKIDATDVDVVMEDINNPLIALDCFIFL